MTKELYNELVDSGFITDTSLTLDKINEMKMELKDIVTQPLSYDYFAKKYDNTPVEEPVVETIEEPITIKEEEIVEIVEVDEPVEEPVIEEVERETLEHIEETSEEIVVDEIEEE